MTPLLKLIKLPGCIPNLKQLEILIAASGKTISRIMSRETGMSYQQWRQQWRLMRSIELMNDKQPLSRVAFELEFSSDSAFISFFRLHTGQTPKHYMQGTN
ncbi:helix-turn-helix domain-containing protein [Dongshaea marina]|uniref:helix-turn-helix domain-containing protein n=1 Tax=Dongshaea marina TaxID=2047966 RepID=UPI001900E239|nr:helix-turn-helix domain-containing protein [Dongshaea marina]